MQRETDGTNSYKEFLKDKRQANREINEQLNSSVLLNHSSNNVVKLLKHYVARSNKEGNLLEKKC